MCGSPPPTKKYLDASETEYMCKSAARRVGRAWRVVARICPGKALEEARPRQKRYLVRPERRQSRVAGPRPPAGAPYRRTVFSHSMQ